MMIDCNVLMCVDGVIHGGTRLYIQLQMYCLWNNCSVRHATFGLSLFQEVSTNRKYEIFGYAALPGSIKAASNR